MTVVKYFPFLFVLILCASCSTTKKTSLEMDPIMHFDPAFIDLGKVKKGARVNMDFPFINSGKEDIEIEIVSGCSCSEITAPVNQVFKSGEKGVVNVVFHSDLEKDNGEMTKVITVLLKQIEAESGYQIIKEVKYKLNLEE